LWQWLAQVAACLQAALLFVEQAILQVAGIKPVVLAMYQRVNYFFVRIYESIRTDFFI
jgi:hypothetical protein